MQFIDKTACTFKSGYIIGPDGVTLIALPHKVCSQIGALDRAWQLFQYLEEQEPACEGPTLEGFRYETWHDIDRAWSYPAAPETPALDARVEETLAYLDDVKANEDYDNLTMIMDRFSDLLDFCAGTDFLGVIDGNIDVRPLSCARIGNPLELKVDDVVAMLKAMVENPLIDTVLR